MHIIPCTTEDIPLMLHYYELAREHQQKKSNRHWSTFDTTIVKSEIEAGIHYKIMEGERVACIFLLIDDDPHIWGARNADPSLYIHRIVTHPDFRGQNYTAKIVEWAKAYGKKHGKEFIRMDTWGDNPALIRYYEEKGFTLLGITTPGEDNNLPAYYNCVTLALLEMKIT